MMYFLIGMIIWLVVGSIVLAFIDDKEKIYKWALEAPFGLTWLIIIIWPVIVFMWMKSKYER